MDFIKFHFEIEFFRTKQEAMRALKTNQSEAIDNNMNNNNNSDSRQVFDGLNIFDTKSMDSFKQEPSFILSTEMCIYIHGALIASIFIIGLMRLN